jgi:hypothetical protein
MTDTKDSEIRSLVYAIVDAGPSAPPFDAVLAAAAERGGEGLQAKAGPRDRRDRRARQTRTRSVLVGASVVAVAVALVIALAVVDSAQSPAPSTNAVPSVSQFYRRLAVALRRPGKTYQANEIMQLWRFGTSATGAPPEQGESDLWIDMAGSASREQTTSPSESVQLVIGDQSYVVVNVIENGVQVGRVDAQAVATVPSSACRGADPALALLLQCVYGPATTDRITASVEQKAYRGRSAFVLTRIVQHAPEEGDFPTTTRFWVDSKTFLPLATVVRSKIRLATKTDSSESVRVFDSEQRWTYRSRFVKNSTVPSDFFSVESATAWVSAANEGLKLQHA